MGADEDALCAESGSGSESYDDEVSTSKSQKVQVNKVPIVAILVVELCERLTYYTLASTQKTYYQNNLGKAPSDAAATNSVFSMLCYFWCIPGGLAADVFGRYKVIVGAAAVYVVGVLGVGLSVITSLQQSWGMVFQLGSLALIPFGCGGIKPNIANFGADQIGDETEKQRECQKTYFSLFYMAINVGVLIAFGFVVNVTTAGLGSFISAADGYAYAYGLGAVSMAAALAIFVSFTKSYKRLPGSGIGPLKCILRYHCYSITNGGGWRAIVSAIGWICMPCFFFATLASVLMPEPDSGSDASESSGHTFVDPCTGSVLTAAATARRLNGGGGGGGIMVQVALVFGIVGCLSLVIANVNTKWVQHLPDDNPVMTVKEVRQAFATMPIIVIVNICYNLCYNAMNNAFPSSACQMNLMLGKSQLNGAFFNLADAVAILVFTPIFETCLFPLLHRLKGSPVRLGQKIITGMLIAAFGNGVAAIQEIQRRNAPFLCNLSDGSPAPFSACAPGYEADGSAGTRMRDYSAFLVFIPFTFIGISEILVNPCMYCFAYESAPLPVRSLLQAIQLFINGCLSNAFTAVVSKAVYPDDLDKGNLEYYYFVNIVISFLGIVMYFCVTRCGTAGRQIAKETRREMRAIEESFPDSDASGSDRSERG